MPEFPANTPKSIADALSAPADGLIEHVTAEHPRWEGNIFKVVQLDVDQPDGTPAWCDSGA